jgi:GTPase SAR1 family protein
MKGVNNMIENTKADNFGDSSPNRRNILLIGPKGTGKTYLKQKWINEFKPNKKPLILHEKENEWIGHDVEAFRIGLLNRKSHLRQIVHDRAVIIDDALNLTKNYADKLLGLASVNRSLNSSFIVSLQGLGVLKERRDALNVFDTIIFFKGSESCAFLVKNTNRFSKEVELIRKEIERLGSREILVYDREAGLWYKTTNDDVQLLNELLTNPLTKGQNLKLEETSSKGSSNNFRIECKKNKIKNLCERGFTDEQIVSEVGTSAGYVTKVKSQLRVEGYNISYNKIGRPRNSSFGGVLNNHGTQRCVSANI